MMYTVGEMAKLLGVPASTLRYYDKEGLLPFVERSPGGMRMFQEKDYEWLQIIGCLKKDRDAAEELPPHLTISQYTVIRRAPVASQVKRVKSYSPAVISATASASRTSRAATS